MFKTHSFKFLDGRLNRAFVSLLRNVAVEHSIDEDGVVSYSAADRDVVENDLICSIRDSVFPAWQVLTCPSDWVATYRDYMSRHQISWSEELSDGELWFLIPRKHRPHLWKLDLPGKKKRLTPSKG